MAIPHPKTEAVAQQTIAQPDYEAKSGFLTKLKNYLAKGGQALRHRNYRLFWTGQLISLIGTWMQAVAQAWLVLTLSHNDPMALGLVGALQFLPTMLFSLFTGVIADRYSKHRLLIITQITAMLLAVLLGTLVVTGWVQLWHVYLCALGLGIVNVLDMPTRQAFVPEMVGREDLMNAVALNSTIFNAGRVVGPAVAGLLIGLGEWIFKSTQAGVALAIWINAASFVAVIVNLLRMNLAELRRDLRRQPTGSVMTNLKEGLSYIRHTPAVMSLIIAVGMMGTFGINYNVWIPILARQNLGVGADGYGILMAALGIGALISALSLAVTQHQPTLRGILIALGSFAIFETGVALSGWYLLSLILMIGTGLFMIRVGASANTLVQMTSPDHLRGRVMSVYMLVFAGTTPIGSLFMGWLGSVGGAPFSMALGAGLSATAIPFVWLYGRRVRSRTSLAQTAVLAESK